MNPHTLLRAPLCLCVIFLSALTSLAAGAELGAMRTLTVAECLRRVAEQSPELKSGMYKTEALERRAKQAARPVNPRLETEIENAAGSGANEGLTAAETTVSFSQEIELGRKRRYRTALADLETAASRVEQRVRLSALLYDARCAVLTVLAAQEKTRLAVEALALARETESVAEVLEQAGKATALETERARAETSKAEMTLEDRKAEQRDAVRDLAQCWGETEPSFDAVDGPFDEEPSPRLPLDELLVRAASGPEWLSAEAQLRAFEARVDVERAARVPNLTLSAGVRRFEEGDDFGFVAGAGIDLPIYTRNGDGVRAAEADAEAVRLETVAVRLKREGRIRQLAARMDTLAAKKTRLKATVIPIAEHALSLVREAHKQGKAGYLDVLEARRTLVAERLQNIETATDYRRLDIELGRLTNTLSDPL